MARHRGRIIAGAICRQFCPDTKTCKHRCAIWERINAILDSYKDAEGKILLPTGMKRREIWNRAVFKREVPEYPVPARY